MTAIERCETLLKEMQELFPQVGLSFGYIGNVERWGDERSWKFFTKVKLPGRDMFYDNCASFGYASTDNLDKLADEAENSLRHWLETKVAPHASKDTN